MDGMGIMCDCLFITDICVFFGFPTQARPSSARRRRPIVFGMPRRCQEKLVVLFCGHCHLLAWKPINFIFTRWAQIGKGDSFLTIWRR